MQRPRALPFRRQRDQRVLHVFERAHDAVLGAQQRFALAAFGDVVDRLRAAGVEDRHGEQARHVGEAGGAQTDAVQRHVLLAERRVEKQPREPFGGGLLAARIGRIELRHQREHVGAALQQRGGLSRPDLWHDHVAVPRLDARGIEGLVADQHRDAMPRHCGNRFQWRDLRARRFGVGLCALHVERRRQAHVVARLHQAQRLVLGGRDRPQGVELAQRTDQREVVGGDVGHHQQAHTAHIVARSQGIGIGRGRTRTQAAAEVDLPRDVQARAAALGVRQGLLDGIAVARVVFDAPAARADAGVQEGPADRLAGVCRTQSLGGDLDVAVFLRRATNQVGQHRVVERLPPGDLGLDFGGASRGERGRHVDLRVKDRRGTAGKKQGNGHGQRCRDGSAGPATGMLGGFLSGTPGQREGG